MKTTKAMASGICLLLAMAAGCSRGDSTGDPLRMPDTVNVPSFEMGRDAHSYTFGGPGAHAISRVDRQLMAGGRELLRGTMEVALADAAPAVVSETAELTATGKLVRATSTLSTGASAPLRSVTLDAVRGSVTVRDEHGERSWSVPADHPWMFTGLFDDIAPHAGGVTPVQVWVARRAAQAGERLRLVEVLAERSSLTVPDQVVFQDGDKDLVVLGDEVAETDASFVRAVPWKALEALAEELRAAELGCGGGPV